MALQDKEDLKNLYPTAKGYSKAMAAAIKHLILFGVVGFDKEEIIGETFFTVEKYLTDNKIKFQSSHKKQLIWTSFVGKSSKIFRQDVSKVYTFHKD